MRSLVVATFLALSACAADLADEAGVAVDVDAEALTILPSQNKVKSPNPAIGADIKPSLQAVVIWINRIGGAPSVWNCAASNTGAICTAAGGWSVSAHNGIGCDGGGVDWMVETSNGSQWAPAYLRALQATQGNTSVLWHANSSTNAGRCLPITQGPTIFSATMAGVGVQARIIY